MVVGVEVGGSFAVSGFHPIGRNCPFTAGWRGWIERTFHNAERFEVKTC